MSTTHSTQHVTISDEMGSRSRRQRHLVRLPLGSLTSFTGDSIPGAIVVTRSEYARNGKWSHTKWDLTLAEGVTLVTLVEPFNGGSWMAALQNLVTGALVPGGRAMLGLADIASALRVGRSELVRFMTDAFPQTLAKFLDIEQALAELDDSQSGGAATLVTNFGGPTRRAREVGYWSWPVLVVATDGTTIGTITPGPQGWGGNDTVVTGSIKLLATKKSSGHGGGHVELHIAAPEGATWAHSDPNAEY